MKKKSFTLFNLLIFIAFYAQAQTGNFYFPPKLGATWQTLPPASLGFCPERIDSLYQFLGTHGTKSFMLLKDGKIVLEKYFGAFTQDSFWYWASAGKSVSSFLVGQAQEEGLLDIDNPVSDYLGAGWTTCPPDKEAKITVWNQLTMTSGLDDALPATPSVPDPDNCTTPACLVYKADAGTRWAYHNAPYRLIHDVLENASGKTLQQFTKTHLLDRTGMKGVWYDHILYGRARDMARYGLLILAGGRWENDTLLHDQDYFYNMTHRSQELNKSYGYLWWLNGQESFMLPSVQFAFPGPLMNNAPPDMFAALGKNDQKVHVVPSKGWVIVRQGEDGGYSGPGGGQVPIVFDVEMWKRINDLACAPSAVTEAAEAGFFVWPNPSANGWNIGADTPFEQVELYDAAGRLVFTAGNLNSTEIFIPAFSIPAGTYCVKAVCGKNVCRQKLVKH